MPLLQLRRLCIVVLILIPTLPLPMPFQSIGTRAGATAPAPQSAPIGPYQYYEIKDLDALQGDEYPVALNDGGAILWRRLDAQGHSHAIVTSGNSSVDLGNLGGGDTYPKAMNASGQVVGTSTVQTENGPIEHSFLYSNGVLTDLSALTDTPPYYQAGHPQLGEATAINDAGVIAAGDYRFYSQVAGAEALEYLWPETDRRAGFHPMAINASGVVVGEYGQHAYIYQNQVLLDLHPSGANASYAVGVNAHGQVLINADYPGGRKSFLYDERGFTDLQSLGGDGGSSPSAINNARQSVGYSWTPLDSVHAFVSQDGVMADLNDYIRPGLGWKLRFTKGINVSGQIIGWGELNSITHAFLLTPRCAQASPLTGDDHDGDALLDDWEVNGLCIDPDGDGPLRMTYVDLPGMGAIQGIPDVFLQVDWMNLAFGLIGTDANCLHCDQRPKSEALKIVRDAFADAPRPINLHIDNGPDSVMDYASGTKWGRYSAAGPRPYKNPLGVGAAPGDRQTLWNDFSTNYREPYFVKTGRTRVFHYALFAHTFYNPDNALLDRYASGGTSFADSAHPEKPGSDFLITLGFFTGGSVAEWGVGSLSEQAGNLMHELGHNLGLQHGGDVGNNYKPNYPSVMNYSYVGGMNTANGVVFDYSYGKRASLYEPRLDETAGVGVLADGRPIIYTCTTGVAPNRHKERKTVQWNTPGYESGQIDWNCDGDTTDIAVQQNIDNSRDSNSNDTYEELKDHDDWGHLVFSSGSIGADGAPYTSGAATETEPYTPAVKAQFAPYSPFILDVTSIGGGYVQRSYPTESSALLTATPDSGMAFGGWLVDGVSAGTVNPLTVPLDASHSIQARFDEAASPSPSPSPSSSPSNSPQATLTVVVHGGGTVQHTVTAITSEDTTHQYPVGSEVSLVAYAASGQMFIGWRVDGIDRGWASLFTITMNGNHTAEATFVPVKMFPDVPRGRPDTLAIQELASRTTIRGYGNGNYGPDDGVQRAQMAALIARATSAGPGVPTGGTITPPACLATGTWDCEDWGNGFSDRNGLDANLWRNVGALQHYQVAFGYDGAACAARGFASPCYAPTASVSYVETIVFITRSMVAKGYWVMQSAAPQPYAGVPAVFGATVATYHFYTQEVGGIPDPPSDWNAGATRGWFARVLWRALDTYWSTDGQLLDGRNAGGFVP